MSNLKILIVGSVITLFLILILWAAATVKLANALASYETIVGIFVTYAIFLYELLMITMVNPIQKWVSRCLRITSRTRGIRILLAKVVNVLLSVVPIITVLFFITIYFASTSALYEILGGITGAWALGYFFKFFRVPILP